MSEIKCKNCGELFIHRENEHKNSTERKQPRFCLLCRREYSKRKNEEREEAEAEKWRIKKQADLELFESELKGRPVISLQDMSVMNPAETLYIVGNGFDLMHGAKSSYYDFGKTIGRNSHLRFLLENYLEVDDLWADFENALAKINVEMMCAPHIIDMFLEDMEAFDEDAGMAEFYCAAEMAAGPAVSFATELKERFDKWIGMITTNTVDRPLREIIKPGGKVLDFNYTEFVEELYDIPEPDICYIHGCRRREKGHSKDKLILGHMPGASDEQYDIRNSYAGVPRKHTQMVYEAQEVALRVVAEADEELTKNCESIIESHRDFFNRLSLVKQVITIGHSLYPVDWDYFSEVMHVAGKDNIQWCFGCFGLADLRRIDAFIKHFEIMTEKIRIFRTDLIHTKPIYVEKARIPPELKRKCIGESSDKKWKVFAQNLRLTVENCETGKASFSLIFPTEINGAIFDCSGTHMFLVARGLYKGVFLLCLKDDKWNYVCELEGIPNQGVITKRLRNVYDDGEHITFVYNSRVRRYSLTDGLLVSNQAVRDASEKSYEGNDITERFKVVYKHGFY